MLRLFCSWRQILLLGLFLAGWRSLAAQVEDGFWPGATFFGPPRSLQLSHLSSPSADTSQVPHVRNEKSPGLAILLSAVLPGIGGQVYTEQYWRIPIYGGLFYWFGRNYLKADDLYKKYRGLYAESVALGVGGGLGDSRYLKLRTWYVGERERFAMYFLLTYLANLMDAYVSASLYSFDVGESLDGTSSVRLQIRFPLSPAVTP